MGIGHIKMMIKNTDI